VDAEDYQALLDIVALSANRAEDMEQQRKEMDQQRGARGGGVRTTKTKLVPRQR